MTLTKTGRGTQVLAGANSFTGLTTILGGTLQIGNGAAGTLNGATGTGLTFSGSGMFTVSEASGVSQGMGALNFSAGEGTVESTNNGGNSFLSFTSMPARSAGATRNFKVTNGTNGTDNSITLTGQGAGYIDQGSFFGGSSYAWMNGAGTYVRGIDYTIGTGDTGAYTTGGTSTIAPTGVANGGGATLHVRTTGVISAQSSAAFTTLNIAGDNAFTLVNGATLTVNGILKSGNNGSPTLISGGTQIQPGAAAEWVVRDDQASDALTIGTPLATNGASTLVPTLPITAIAVTTIRPAIRAYSNTSPPRSSFINRVIRFFMPQHSNSLETKASALKDPC